MLQTLEDLSDLTKHAPYTSRPNPESYKFNVNEGNFRILLKSWLVSEYAGDRGGQPVS